MSNLYNVVSEVVADRVYNYKGGNSKDKRVFWTQANWVEVLVRFMEMHVSMLDGMTKAEIVKYCQSGLHVTLRRTEEHQLYDIYPKLEKLGQEVRTRMASSKKTAAKKAVKPLIGWPAPSAPAPTPASVSNPFPQDSLAGKAFSVLASDSSIPDVSKVFHQEPMTKHEQDVLVSKFRTIVVEELAKSEKKLELTITERQLQMQKELLMSMDKLYNGILREWADTFPPSPIASDVDVAESRLKEVQRQIRLADLPAKPRKKTVLVYGAMPAQLQSIQAKVPEVEVWASKKDGHVDGDYDLVVAITQHSTTEQQHRLRKQFGDKFRMARGAMTSVVEVIKNSLMLA